MRPALPGRRRARDNAPAEDGALKPQPAARLTRVRISAPYF